MANDKLESEIDDWMEELGGDDNPFAEDELAGVEADSPVDSASETIKTASEEAEDVPIDQSAIDALMAGSDDGAVDSGEDGQGLVDPAAFDAAFDAAVGSGDEVAPEPQSEEEGPVDQATIDALMGGGDEESTEAAAAAPADDVSMSQDDLDALLAGDDEVAPEPQQAEAPVDQATIDALMGGGDEESAEAAASPPADDVSMSQDDLDALLNGSDSAASTEAEDQIDQSEIDALFSGVEEDSDSAASSPGQTEMDELFAEGSDEGSNLFAPESSPPEQGDELFEFAGNELSDGEEEMAPSVGASTAADTEETILEVPKEKFKFTPPAWLTQIKGSRTMWTGLGVFLALIIGTGGYFSLSSKDEKPAISIPVMEMVAENTTVPTAKQPISPVDTPLASVDIQIAMDPAADKVNINLAAGAPEDQELDYVITSLPTAGLLQGDPPELVYTPAPGFSGKDGFVYCTSDGKALSSPAHVFIQGQARQAMLTTGKPRTIEPRMSLVKAVDLTLEILSTDNLNIDWRNIWEQANGSSFSRKVQVKVLGSPTHGTLRRLSRQSHKYAPDPYRSGIDSLSYRFDLAGVRSKTRQLRIKVVQGDPPPALELSPMGKVAYSVGDAVLLDAGATKDDDPASLAFSWQQLAGVPIRLESMNQAGSIITFVVPSSFYTAQYPKPIIKLTVTDRSGQTASRKITINAGHGSQAAAWNGLHGDDLAKLNTNSILPWSY